MLQLWRQGANGDAAQIDRFLLKHLSAARLGVVKAGQCHKEMEAILSRLTASPWHLAVFVDYEQGHDGPRAVVAFGGRERLVSLADGVDRASLRKGEIVYLSNEQNTIMAKAACPQGRVGEIAYFDRYTEDNRLVLKHRDEEVILEAAAALQCGLKSGDLIRYDKDVHMAFERLERSKGEHLFLEETPKETFAQVGGLDAQIQQVQRLIKLHLHHADTASKYGLTPKGSVLIHGPVGTGKTLFARALANWLASLSPSSRSRFIHVKPGSLHSMWYAQSEANYREVFRVARETAAQSAGVPVVMFFDEVDAIGSIRGGLGAAESAGRVDDRVLTAFMAELDGLEARGNILIVAASNRLEVLDPALIRPGRLGDLILAVPRPNIKAARAIFETYLKPDLPYAADEEGDNPLAMRDRLIGSAVSRIYANGDGTLATITFRDGTQRPIRPADLVSGAVVANICRSALERACYREVECNRSGLRLDDVLSAVADEFETCSRVLTPANCSKYLVGLPQDMAVAKVEPVIRKTARAHRFLMLE